MCPVGAKRLALAARDILSPFFGMWSANILIGLMGIYLTMRIGRETLVINWDFLWRLVPRRWRSSWNGADRDSATA